MNPNSRSPWAAWCRFMKSMSISAQGRSRLNCVCRCRSGLRSASRPPIHIRAGENVCIQAMTPTQASAALASWKAAAIPSGDLTTGRYDDPHWDRRRRVERRHDPLRVGRDLAQRLVAVEVLAAGEEPDFELVQGLHVTLHGADLMGMLPVPVSVTGTLTRTYHRSARGVKEARASRCTDWSPSRCLSVGVSLRGDVEGMADEGLLLLALDLRSM